MPEEDKYLCTHEWVHIEFGAGVSKENVKIALQTFYCKWCLEIRTKSYSQSRFSISREFIEQFNEDNGEGVI